MRLRQVTVSLLLAGLSLVFRVDAASSATDEQAFSSAYEPFLLKEFRSADTDLGAFIQRFPQSPRRAEAVLLQARARIELTNYPGAIELLTNSVASAGTWTAEYLYRLGTAQLGSGDPAEAAKAFARVNQITNAPDWLRRVSSLGEAEARFARDDFSGVVDLLSATNGPLEGGLTNVPVAETMVRGQLRLADALLKLRRFPELDRALETLSKIQLEPEFDWQRLWLQATGRRDQGDLTNALAVASNLVVVARSTGRQDMLAESRSLLGGIHRQSSQLNEAIAAFRENLATNAPVAARQQALISLISIQLERDQFAEANRELRNYTTQFPQESNVWSLASADLQLREYSRQINPTNATSPQLTQMLAQVHTTLTRVANAFTSNELQGRLQFLLGWCFWQEANYDESAKAFQFAATNLPPSTDQLLARFKLGDSQLKRGDAIPAAATYRRLLEDIPAQPAAQRLVEPLLSQWLRACIQAGDLAGAEQAIQRLLLNFPESRTTEAGFLLWLQAAGPSDAASVRKLYQDFASRFPKSPQLPNVALEVARSYERERDWPHAFTQYDEWLTRHGGNTHQPFVEYHRALCAWWVGDATNAFQSMSRLVERYPSNSLTPLALQWIAEDYLRSEQWQQAERTYKNIFSSPNWPVSEVTIAARMGAARAAFANQGWSRAREYLTNAVTQLETITPPLPDLRAKANLMLGDTILEQYLDDPNRPEATWNQAIVAYGFVAGSYTNELAARAYGKLGVAYFVRESQSTNYLSKAINHWQQVIELELNQRKVASVELRSQAEYALGKALERQALQTSGKEREALLNGAQDHYGNVIFKRKHLETEELDPWWYKETALAAARFALERGEIPHAESVYEAVRRKFPVLSAELDRLIQLAKVRAKEQNK